MSLGIVYRFQDVYAIPWLKYPVGTRNRGASRALPPIDDLGVTGEARKDSTKAFESKYGSVPVT